MNRVNIDKINLTDFDTSLTKYTPVESMLLAKRLADYYNESTEFNHFISRVGFDENNENSIIDNINVCPSLKSSININITNCIVAIQQGLKINTDGIFIISDSTQEWVMADKVAIQHKIGFVEWINKTYLDIHEKLEYFHSIENIKYVENDLVLI